ncbi:MAG: decarboxylating NADP(+)-dependent phosphogluconate dehydrogenase [Acidimicrobiia bacterium]
MSAVADIGVVGLAVMGRNLILNMDDHGFTVAAYNRTSARVDEFLAGDAAGTRVVGAHSLEELVGLLRTPRRIMMMIRAGDAVDDAVDALIPLLDPGDIIIDGGNSLYTDTMARTARVEAAGLLYVGAGVSGGEEGARTGPSIMPGGSAAAWPYVREIFQSIAAYVDGVPCCDWVGADGAGHYVKMVHNGIEYGDMQVIAEAYDLMHRGLGMTHDEMAETFDSWNRGKLDSYLVEITGDIMTTRDDAGDPLLEKILDAAGQKGTGKWTVISSMDFGQPVTLFAEAVYARIVSSLADTQSTSSHLHTGPPSRISAPREEALSDLHDALYASKIISYAQGFMLMEAAAREHEWDLDFASIASMWRGGCIIRSRFLGEIMRVYAAEQDTRNLLLSEFFRDEIAGAQPGWRRTVHLAVESGIPVPAYSSALAFFDGFRTARLPANLIQAQRDYFGAHTYERVDRARGEFFHTNWTGSGGDVASTAYNV